MGARTTDWLVARTRDLAAQLQAQEAAVQKYKADNNLTEAADGTSLAEQQITAISNQLVTAKADLAQKQATDERVAALIKAGDTADVSQILASPLIVQLRTQQATLIGQESELSTRYGPRHPKLQAVETQKRDLDAKIATEVGRLTGSISNDVAVARANVASLQASLSQAGEARHGTGFRAREIARAAIQRRFHPHDVRSLRHQAARDPGPGRHPEPRRAGDLPCRGADGAELAQAHADPGALGPGRSCFWGFSLR